MMFQVVDLPTHAVLAEVLSSTAHHLVDASQDGGLDAEERLARELLGAVSGSDLEDALEASLLSVDDWALARRRWLRDDVSVALVVGAARESRLVAAYERIADVVARTPKPARTRSPQWSALLYREDIPPTVRLRMCQMMMGHAAHLALIRAFEAGQPLAEYLAEGLVACLERGADASVSLSAARA